MSIKSHILNRTRSGLSVFKLLFMGVHRFRICDRLDREARQEAEIEAGEDKAEGEEHGERAVRRPLQSCREHAKRSGGHSEEHLHTAGVRLGAAHKQTGTKTITILDRAE